MAIKGWHAKRSYEISEQLVELQGNLMSLQQQCWLPTYLYYPLGPLTDILLVTLPFAGKHQKAHLDPPFFQTFAMARRGQ